MALIFCTQRKLLSNNFCILLQTLAGLFLIGYKNMKHYNDENEGSKTYDGQHMNISNLDILPNTWMMQLSDDGELLAIIYYDGDIEIIETQTLEIKREISIQPLICSAADKILFFSADKEYMLCQQTPIIIAISKMKYDNEEQKKDIEYLIKLQSPGQLLQINEKNQIFIQTEKRIKVYQIEPFQFVKDIELDSSNIEFVPLKKLCLIVDRNNLWFKYEKNLKTIKQLCYTRDEEMKFYSNRLLVLGTSNISSKIILWQAGSGKQIRNLKLNNWYLIQNVLMEHEVTVYAKDNQKIKQINCLKFEEKDCNFRDQSESTIILSSPNTIVLKNLRQAIIYSQKKNEIQKIEQYSIFLFEDQFRFLIEYISKGKKNDIFKQSYKNKIILQIKKGITDLLICGLQPVYQTEFLLYTFKKEFLNV